MKAIKPVVSLVTPMRVGFRGLFLIIFSIVGLVALPVAPVHAAGLLFVSPSSTPTITTGSTFTVQVQAANIDPFTGWDVEIRTDQAVLNPVSISTDGNLLAANFGATILVASNCVNGQGSGCGSEDGLGVVHSAAVALGSRSLPPGPTSGLLFSITYTALNGGTGVSLIEIIRQVIVNGVADSFVTVSASNGLYGSVQDFGVGLSPIFGTVSQGNQTMLTATVYSFNGFSGQVNLTEDSVLSAYVQPASVFLPPDGTATASILASSTLCDIPSIYSIDIFASSGNVSHTIEAFPSLVPSTSLSPDFCMIRDERSANVNAGSRGAIPFLLRSVNNFNGTVSMTVSIIPELPNGPVVTLASNQVTMYPGGFGAGNIQVSTMLGTLTGEYTVVVNATAGRLEHFLTERLEILPPISTFAITASSNILQVAPSSNTTDTVTLKGLLGFNAPVALGTSIQPFLSTGPTVQLSAYTFPLSGIVNVTLTVSAPRKATLGLYNVTVFANGGGQGASITLTVNVTLLAPPFFIQFQPVHDVSIGKSGGVATFLSGVHNPNHDTAIFLTIQVTGTDGSGTQTFTLTTGLIQLGPNGSMSNLALAVTFGASNIGTTFHYTALILWGTSPTSLSITGSSQPRVPVSGTFTVEA